MTIHESMGNLESVSGMDKVSIAMKKSLRTKVSSKFDGDATGKTVKKEKGLKKDMSKMLLELENYKNETEGKITSLN